MSTSAVANLPPASSRRQKLAVIKLFASAFVYCAAMSVSFAAPSASFTAGIVIGAPAKHRGPVLNVRYTWRAAQISVARAGYRDISRLTRANGIYWFTARRHRSRTSIGVSAWNGDILSLEQDRGHPTTPHRPTTKQGAKL